MAREYIYGRNAVVESLRAGRRRHETVYLADTLERDARIDEVRMWAEQLSLEVVISSRAEIESLAPSGNQGVLLATSRYPYATGLGLHRPRPDEILIAFDELEDPRNVGSLLRTAEAAGVAGVVLPERRSVEVTPTVVNIASGATEHLQIQMEKNLARWLASASDNGYWLIGLDGSEGSEDIFDADLPLPAVVVVGSEGSGLRRLTRDKCDLLVRIPMYGEIQSLNAAAAGSIALYHLREFGS